MICIRVCTVLCVNIVRVANMLTGPCGLSRGDSVLVVLPKLPEWWLLNIACARAGNTPTIRLRRIHEMQTIVVDGPGVCQSVSLTQVLYKTAERIDVRFGLELGDSRGLKAHSIR